MMSDLPSAPRSLPTTRSLSTRHRHTSYRPRPEKHTFAQRQGRWEATRLPLCIQLLCQVEATHVEAELGAQHGEEAEDVIAGLSKCVGRQIHASSPKLPECAHATLIAVGDLQRVRRALEE